MLKVATERLYYTDSYLTEFQAQIVDRSRDGLRVYLDRTAFYPASGGQPFDLGWLGANEVVEVVDEEDRIAHILSESVPTGPVTGKINWRAVSTTCSNTPASTCFPLCWRNCSAFPP